MAEKVESTSVIAGGRRSRLVVGSYFDGERHHERGPYAITLDGGLIVAIERAAPAEPVVSEFVMPALVDSHVHCFLDGSLVSSAARQQHLEQDIEGLFTTSRNNARFSWEFGISLLRDAGDRYGVNDALREWLRAEDSALKLRSPSFALHRPGRYGSFLGRAVADDRELVPVVRELAQRADQIKVLLTGPIDFLARRVKGEPQFDLPALQTIVATAREMDKTVFAHCSGIDGLAIATAAGLDSIEHGYFMDEDSLRAMADRGIAWTPTMAPVIAQRHLAEQGGDAALEASLDEILARHRESIARAEQLGVALLCGSDAGSPGVPHGQGLLEEMVSLVAAGVSVEAVLRAATSAPRARWGEATAAIAVGMRLDAAGLERSPFVSPEALRTARRLLV